jgi:hypothetical protein
LRFERSKASLVGIRPSARNRLRGIGFRNAINESPYASRLRIGCTNVTE